MRSDIDYDYIFSELKIRIYLYTILNLFIRNSGALHGFPVSESIKTKVVSAVFKSSSDEL